MYHGWDKSQKKIVSALLGPCLTAQPASPSPILAFAKGNLFERVYGFKDIIFTSIRTLTFSEERSQG